MTVYIQALTPGARGKPVTVLVMLCSNLEDAVPGLNLSELRPSQTGLQGEFDTVAVEDLCHNLGAITGLVREYGAERLVLGLCSQGPPLQELQAQARKAGLDPLGIQTVNLGSCCEVDTTSTPANALSRAVLTGAVVRAMSFPGSQPENLKAVLPSPRRRVSRRALLTLPLVSYTTAPTISRGLCAAPDGCEQCVSSCPHGALEEDGDRILVNRAQCQSCGVCVSVCPQRAVEFPGSSPEELEAQLSSLLDRRDGPSAKAVAFVCDNGSAPNGPGWLPIKVPCLSMVSAGAILETLARGGEAVSLLSCGEGCRQGLADAVAGRVDFCGQVLELLGDPAGKDRVQLMIGSETERAKPAASLPPLPGDPNSKPPTLFGKGVAARAVNDIAARFGMKDLILEHPHSPLGLVEVDAQACTVCGACAAGCPTGALSYDQRSDGVDLSFDPTLCTACERCVAVCPEVASDAIRLDRTTDRSRLAQGRRTVCSDIETRCVSCGGPVAPLAMLRRIASLLGEEEADLAEEMSRYCLSCRGYPGDGSAGL